MCVFIISSCVSQFLCGFLQEDLFLGLGPYYSSSSRSRELILPILFADSLRLSDVYYWHIHQKPQFLPKTSLCRHVAALKSRDLPL